MNKTLVSSVAAMLFVFALAGCGKKEPPAATPAAVAVASVTLGKAIGADKRVTAPADSFAKADTIYAAVETTGSGNATLRAKWTFHKGDKAATVNENTQTLAATGPAVTEFHISKPDGWPVGDYQLEVFLNDASTGARKFTVK